MAQPTGLWGNHPWQAQTLDRPTWGPPSGGERLCRSFTELRVAWKGDTGSVGLCTKCGPKLRNWAGWLSCHRSPGSCLFDGVAVLGANGWINWVLSHSEETPWCLPDPHHVSNDEADGCNSRLQLGGTFCRPLVRDTRQILNTYKLLHHSELAKH